MKSSKKNVLLKLASFLMGVAIWYYIVLTVNAPVDKKIKNVKINLIGEDSLVKSGLSVIGEKDLKVNLKIKGSRFALSEINSKNITATANLTHIMESGKYKIPINVIFSVDDISVTSKKPYTVDLVIDKLKEKRLNIRTNTMGNLESKFIHYETKVTPSSILVSGSEKILDQINDAIVDVDYNNVSHDINGTFKIKLIDKSNEEIRSNLIIKDFNEVIVSCKIGKLKTVEVVPNIKNKENFSTSGMTVLPATVTIYGDSKSVEKISKIYTEQVQITASNNQNGEELSAKILVPDNIYLRDNIGEVILKINPTKLKN